MIFKKDQEVFSDFEDFSIQNKTFFMRPILSNHKAIDACYFSASSRKEINPFPDCLDKLNDLVVYFQVKKDLKLCCKYQSEIKSKWKEFKSQLKQKHNCSKLDFILVIINEYQSKDDPYDTRISWKSEKEENDIFFMFSDRDNNNIFDLKIFH